MPKVKSWRVVDKPQSNPLMEILKAKEDCARCGLRPLRYRVTVDQLRDLWGVQVQRALEGVNIEAHISPWADTLEMARNYKLHVAGLQIGLRYE